ncbi:MAG: Uma2 family endonuclease [Chloroflexi bacterium]|nr:Uma2 family endonuclease [Chloroflexota bacterium]
MTTAPKARIVPDDALVINLRDLGVLATGPELDRLFAKFCDRNSQSVWQYELTPEGEIVVLPPINHPGGLHENETATELNIWRRGFGGMATGSNAFYRMPITGGVLVPDAAWVSPERLSEHPPVPGDPIPICPDFVIEIRSGTDNLAPLHAKMRLYMQNGALLGWLIDPINRRVYIYRYGQTEAEPLENPLILSGEDVLPGFTFDVARWIFDRT